MSSNQELNDAATKLQGQRYPQSGGFIDDKYSSRCGPSAEEHEALMQRVARLELLAGILKE